MEQVVTAVVSVVVGALGTGLALTWTIGRKVAALEAVVESLVADVRELRQEVGRVRRG